MIYLEDLAVWVKTKKAIIIRNVICGIGGLIIVGMFIAIGVFACTAIIKDAYIGVKQNIRSWIGLNLIIIN